MTTTTVEQTATECAFSTVYGQWCRKLPVRVCPVCKGPICDEHTDSEFDTCLMCVPTMVERERDNAALLGAGLAVMI